MNSTQEGRLWNEFVARHHYLGYKTLVGAQMRYAVHDRNGWPIAMLGFSTAAWKLAPRDNFIGWTPEKREKNLPLVVDNPRFLILPWIETPNLGSHIAGVAGDDREVLSRRGHAVPQVLADAASMSDGKPGPMPPERPDANRQPDLFDARGRTDPRQPPEPPARASAPVPPSLGDDDLIG